MSPFQCLANSPSDIRITLQKLNCIGAYHFHGNACPLSVSPLYLSPVVDHGCIYLQWDHTFPSQCPLLVSED
jgi:hypothetical protein